MNLPLKRILFLPLLIIVIGLSCKESNNSSGPTEIELPHSAISDSKAEDIVTKMETAMGGLEKWDNLHYASWTFFGSRHLVWDKQGGKVRIDSPRDSSIYLVDLVNHTGRIIKGGKEVKESEELEKLITRGNSIWINDSYWLFMPFKLRDPGVTVKYLREDTIVGGTTAFVLEMTFNDVGNTPENKYEVYIDQSDNLIKQWAFYEDVNQETPPRVWPWDNYKSHNGLFLSSERSDKGGPSNVRVYETLHDSVFNSFKRFDYF
jgi:hypothetical protein